MLSEREHRPALLGRGAADRPPADLAELYLADAISRFKGAPEHAREPHLYTAEEGSTRAAYEQLGKLRRAQHVQAVPQTSDIADKDELLHHQLLRGVHKVWNQRPATGGSPPSVTGHKSSLRNSHRALATSGAASERAIAQSTTMGVSSSPLTVSWRLETSPIAEVENFQHPSATSLESFSMPEKLHPASAVRRRQATLMAAANQRRRVELRAAKESIVRELMAEQQRANTLQTQLELRIAELDREHRTELGVMHAALADAELQVGAALRADEKAGGQVKAEFAM